MADSSQVGGKYNFPMDQRLLNIYARNTNDPIVVKDGNPMILKLLVIHLSNNKTLAQGHNLNSKLNIHFCSFDISVLNTRVWFEPLYRYTYMPTQRIINNDPRPMKVDAAIEIISSFIMSLVYLVDVTSYTKNHAVKNKPIRSNTKAR